MLSIPRALPRIARQSRCVVASNAALAFSTTATTRIKISDYLHNDNLDWTESMRDVRAAMQKLLVKYDDDYWHKVDEKGEFPTELTKDLAAGGWLGICMPEEYGGSAMGISEAAVLMQSIAETGGCMTAASSVHMNIFGLEPVVKFGSKEQKDRMLPGLIAGTQRACFGVTEPNSGLDTLKLQTRAVRKGDRYEITGNKMWISTAQVADKILLLARTTPLEEVKKKTHGLSLFYTDFDRAKVEVKEIHKMGRAAIDSNLLFFDGWSIPAEDRIGEEGDGFKAIMHGMNAERILVAVEALGAGYAAIRRASRYATERHVFGRAIGKNQSIQHPLAESWMQLEAARLIAYKAAALYDGGHESGEYANAAKFLAAEAAHLACQRAVMTHGGVGYAREYHVERYMREIWLPRLTPVSQQMVLNYISERVLGQEKSY